MSAIIDKATELLKEHWGHPTLKPEQEQVIEATMAGRDVFAMLATSGGKSVMFQIPAMLREGTTIVVTPLIALMKDQVASCKKRNISASYVSHQTDQWQTEERIDNLLKGEYQLFYVSPERLRSPKFIDVLCAVDIACFAADECHCASRYGKDFRPAYNRVCDVVQHIEDSAKKRPPIIAVTATATPDIEKDIGRALGMRKWVRVIGDPIRPNFTYAVERGNDFARLRNLFRGQLDPNNGRYILYCGTQKSCEKVSEILRSMIDCPVAFYHAGMHRHDRADAQEDFTEGRTRIICATNAFGMGIDIPDIRAIIHLGIPGSVEDYVQEAGRAGRDGGPALALLIDNDYSHGLRQRFVDEANPDWALYEPVWNWLNKTFTDRSEVKAFNFTQASAQVSTEYNVPISSYLFAAVLDTMEAYGAIRSIPNATGQSLTVRAEKLRRAIEGNLIEDKSSREVAMALWETFVREAYEVRGEKTPASVASLEDIADSVNMSLNTVRDALRELSADRLLSLDAGSYGRPIRMTGFEEDLTEFLTAADVEDKRVREQRRLDTMLDYTLVADRAGFIRKYFTGQ